MDPPDSGASAFAVVHDVAASWQDYHLIRQHLVPQTIRGISLPGLILHAAGPTQDGFRTIDVWDCEAAWVAYRARLAHAFDDLAVPPVVRELHIGHLISAPAQPVTPSASS